MGSPVDDALNRQLVPLTRAAAEAADADLQAEFMRLNPELQRRVALGVLEIDALRRQVEQLREERDDLYENNWPWEWVIAGREKERRQAAEAEVQRLREGLRETMEAATPDDNYAGYGEIMEALERERDEWRALVLDMGEFVRANTGHSYTWNGEKNVHKRGCEKCALLARLDQLGKEQTDG